MKGFLGIDLFDPYQSRHIRFMQLLVEENIKNVCFNVTKDLYQVHANSFEDTIDNFLLLILLPLSSS